MLTLHTTAGACGPEPSVTNSAGMETYKSWCRCKGGTFEYSRTGSWCKFGAVPDKKSGSSAGSSRGGAAPSSSGQANAQATQIFGATMGLSHQLDAEARSRRQKDAADAALRKEQEERDLSVRGERLSNIKSELKDADLDSPDLQFKLGDSCEDVLKAQEAALERARQDQKDIYWAIGTADFNHGMELLSEAFKAGPKSPQEPSLYIYRNEDKAGIRYYLRDYKTTTYGLLDNRHAQAAAASQPGFAGKKIGFADSLSDGKMTPAQVKEKLEALTEKGKEVSGYAAYVEEVLRCADVPDEKFNGCVEKANALHDKTIENFPFCAATKKRLEQARDALRGYSMGLLRRATEAADAASRCPRGG